ESVCSVWTVSVIATSVTYCSPLIVAHWYLKQGRSDPSLSFGLGQTLDSRICELVTLAFGGAVLNAITLRSRLCDGVTPAIDALSQTYSMNTRLPAPLTSPNNFRWFLSEPLA